MATEAVSRTERAVAALLFMNGTYIALDVFSSLMSSPWTVENFGADQSKADSARANVRRSLILSAGYGVASSVIARSWWPIIGTGTLDLYMWWSYEQALRKGKTNGNTGWENQ